ncbi:MAG: hypothetical protein JRN35_10325, partial [Nitrososphaerota archaeon]|nr:hypothetical protein [Nitrososphaerota archaeon]
TYLTYEKMIPVEVGQVVQWIRNAILHPEKNLSKRQYESVRDELAVSIYKYKEPRPRMSGIIRNPVPVGPAQFREGVLEIHWDPYQEVDDGIWYAARQGWKGEGSPFEVFGKSREITTLLPRSEWTQMRKDCSLELVSAWAMNNWHDFEARYVELRRGMLDILVTQIEKSCRSPP